MAVVCDTSIAAGSDRTELWVAAASKQFVPLECTPSKQGEFHGRMRAGAIGPLRLCALEVSPHTVRRTPRLAANSNGDQYKLSLILKGQAMIAQDRREAVLGPGDFAIYDCSRPYTLVGGEDLQMIICVLPRDIIGVSPEQIGRITAARISGRSGIAWAISPFLRRLTELAVDDRRPVDEHHVVEGVVDLVDSLCVSTLGHDHRSRAYSHAELVLRIRAFIETHLGEPDLSPSRIATAHYISVRLLHKLFESEGTSVARWIRQRRLECCRRDLADPSLRAETVTGICTRWGMPDPCHFSRLFRSSYGCSPTEYRREHLS